MLRENIWLEWNGTAVGGLTQPLLLGSSSCLDSRQNALDGLAFEQLLSLDCVVTTTVGGHR